MNNDNDQAKVENLLYNCASKLCLLESALINFSKAEKILPLKTVYQLEYNDEGYDKISTTKLNLSTLKKIAPDLHKILVFFKNNEIQAVKGAAYVLLDAMIETGYNNKISQSNAKNITNKFIDALEENILYVYYKAALHLFWTHEPEDMKVIDSYKNKISLSNKMSEIKILSDKKKLDKDVSRNNKNNKNLGKI